MASRLWIGNPGCVTDDCCVTEPPPTACCPDAPTTLYLNDGIGEVEMIYDGPRPVTLGTASTMWWGCATRAATGGRTKALSGDCNTTPVNFDTEIIFGLWCKSSIEGYRLYIFHDGCGIYEDIPPTLVQTHQKESLGCSTPWVGQYNQIVGGSINGILPSDCSPFVWGPVSESFPSTYPHHPLREIYGDSATWVISE